MRGAIIIVLVSYFLATFASPDVILTGSTYTIVCHLDLEKPAWNKLNQYENGSDMITYGGSGINPDYYAKDRISYSSNNRDLVLKDVTLEDAAKYRCSKAGKGYNDTVFRVDDATLKQSCPAEDSSGVFQVSTGCLTMNVVTAKWIYKLEDGTEHAVENATEKITMSGCTEGKSRLTSWFEHSNGGCIRCPSVSILFVLKHSDVTKKFDCGKKYFIDFEGNDGPFIVCIVVFCVHLVTAICSLVLFFKKHKWKVCDYPKPAICLLISAVIQFLPFILINTLPPELNATPSLEYSFPCDIVIFIFTVLLFLMTPLYIMAYWMWEQRSKQSIWLSIKIWDWWMSVKNKEQISKDDEMMERLLDCFEKKDGEPQNMPGMNSGASNEVPLNTIKPTDEKAPIDTVVVLTNAPSSTAQQVTIKPTDEKSQIDTEGVLTTEPSSEAPLITKETV